MQDDGLGAILRELGVLRTLVSEVRDDVKETRAQATATNGRVNRHDTALELLVQRVESLEAANSSRRAAGWQVATWVIGPVSAALGAGLTALLIGV